MGPAREPGGCVAQVKGLPIEGILVADYINPNMAQRLKDRKIQFIDTVGNAYLDLPPTFIFVKGNRETQETKLKHYSINDEIPLPGGQIREGLVLTSEHEHTSGWAAIQSLATKMGGTPETLRAWINQMEVDTGARSGVTRDQSTRMKALARENRALKRANEILKKAAAFFAQAEFDRKPR